MCECVRVGECEHESVAVPSYHTYYYTTYPHLSIQYYLLAHHSAKYVLSLHHNTHYHIDAVTSPFPYHIDAVTSPFPWIRRPAVPSFHIGIMSTRSDA
jgi:hypothetical protein